MREDWVKTYLLNICDVLDNLRKPINTSERTKRVEGKPKHELYPYYGATGQVGYIDDYLTDGEYVLIGEDGAPFLDYTKPVAYKINGKTWVNNHAHILKSFFNNDYLLHYLNQFQYRDYVTGTTRLKLTQGALKKMPVKLAPLPIQRAIVTKIENLFTSLDKGIADLKKAQEKLKVYRQAVLKKAFEGGLTNRNVKVGELPEGWQWVKIDTLIETEKNAIKAGPFGSSLKKEFYVTDGYKIYGQEQVIRGNPFYGDYYIDEQKYQELISCRVKPGDILISLVGTVGKVLVLPYNIKAGIINPRLIKISLSKSKYDNKFFKYYFESSAVKSIYKINASGTTMDVLNIGIIKKIPFPLPSTLAEQHAIVRQIESRLSVCDKIEQSITEGLEKSEALRQSILKKAFEGKLLSDSEIEKCKQEADYEPASVLLERIKKEKKK